MSQQRPGAVTPARRAAASVLDAVARGRRLDLAFASVARTLPEADRRWVHEAAYGTLRFRGRLDYLLGLHLRQGTSSLAPRVLELLRLGAFQILYLRSVPDYAAVSQTVSQVKAIAGSGAGRLANAVLRSLAREGGGVERFPRFEEDPLEHLSTWGAHPKWLVRRWLRRWGPEETLKLVEWNNTPPPLYVRPLREPLAEAAARLRAREWLASEPSQGSPCLEVRPGIKPAQLLETVTAIVQDPGAALVTLYADVPEGKWVADLCAAPGGKALALAASGAYVLAADRSLPRLRRLVENANRVGVPVGAVAADALAPPLCEAPFVLLDVPCTGTGTLRRHPDAKWRLAPEAIRSLARLQGRMLERGAALVEVGGHLVYATCSLEEEENEARIDAFLARRSEFAIEATAAVADDFLDGEGRLSILPQRSGFDGAFAARMVRKR